MELVPAAAESPGPALPPRLWGGAGRAPDAQASLVLALELPRGRNAPRSSGGARDVESLEGTRRN